MIAKACGLSFWRLRGLAGLYVNSGTFSQGAHQISQ
jgi:hypothetical protein